MSKSNATDDFPFHDKLICQTWYLNTLNLVKKMNVQETIPTHVFYIVKNSKIVNPFQPYQLRFICLYLKFDLFLPVFGKVNFVDNEKPLSNNFLWDPTFHLYFLKDCKLTLATEIIASDRVRKQNEKRNRLANIWIRSFHSTEKQVQIMENIKSMHF